MSIMKMRERHGWGTRGIIYAIIVAFALFGLGSIQTFFAPVAKVATVNGEDITVGEMEVAVERNRRMLLGQGATPEDINEDELRANVLQSLVSRRLLVQGVDALDMTVGESRLDEALLATETFQIDGIFDENQYRLVLASVGYNPVTYKEELRRDQTISQLARTIQNSAIVTDQEALRASSLSRQTRDVAVLTFDPIRFESEVAIQPEETEQYYLDHQSEFFSEETVDLAYVSIDRAAMAAEVTVTEDALLASYNDQKDRFSTPEARRIAHILVATDDRSPEEARVLIEAAQNEINEGKPFADVARERSDDPGSASQGGDLGVAARGIFVPAFEEAAFGLTEVGEISEVVETEFGLHLIRLSEWTPSQVKPFEDVRAEVEKQYRNDQVEDEFVRLVTELDELAFEEPDLSLIADQLSLTVDRIPSVTREDRQGILSNARVRDAMFSPDVLVDRNNSPLIEITSDLSIVLHVENHAPSELLAQEMVADRIEAKLIGERSAALALEKANTALAMLEDGDLTRFVADQFGLEWNVVSKASRYAPGLDAEIRREAFSLPKPGKLEKALGLVVLSDGGAAVISVTNVENGPTASEPNQGQALRQMLSFQRGGLDFAGAEQTLRDEGSVSGG
ncbi:MAG: SurA N-terminal domain-containing protein [Pseudomonadales bacterium]